VIIVTDAAAQVVQGAVPGDGSGPAAEVVVVAPLGPAHDLTLGIHPPHDGTSAGAVAD
jgi:hypothetical protein